MMPAPVATWLIYHPSGRNMKYELSRVTMHNSKDGMNNESADLLASLAAIGRAMQEAFDPGGRYAPAELVLDSVLAGEAMRVGNFQTDPQFVRPGVEAGEPVLIRDTWTELDPARAALHLDLFEQPGRKRIFPQPARTCSWRSFLNASSKTKQTSAHDWTFLESLLFGPSLEPVFSRG